MGHVANYNWTANVTKPTSSQLCSTVPSPMVTGIPQSGLWQTKPETQRLLTVADYFLQRRGFADCCKYAVRARDSDPTHPSPTRLICIASVLSVSMISSTQHDYYAVLNLPNFESDFVRIESNFETLTSILAPSANACPLTSEAFDLVMKAWSVLSNSVEKEKYDDELRMRMAGGCTSRSGGDTFWTMCPYCYYVFEYEKVFEDCCLRCANERCRRVLHAAAIAAPPPPDVVAKGQYLCPGFMPFAISNSNGQRTRMNLWNPFGVAVGLTGEGFDGNVSSHRDRVAVASDDETVEVKEIQNHGYSNGGNTIEEARTKRRDSGSRDSYELIGKEARIHNNLANYDSLEERQDVDSTLDEVKIGVDFFEGDDEIFLSLPCDLDLECEEKEAVLIK
ncbi:hypothetical protein ACS0TY_008858 [Phlomoides rotata]